MLKGWGQEVEDGWVQVVPGQRDGFEGVRGSEEGFDGFEYIRWFLIVVVIVIIGLGRR